MVLPLEGKNKIHLFNSMTSLFLDCTYCSVFVIDIHIIFEHTCQNLGVETSLVKKIAEDRKNYKFNGGAQSIKSFSFLDIVYPISTLTQWSDDCLTPITYLLGLLCYLKSYHHSCGLEARCSEEALNTTFL